MTSPLIHTIVMIPLSTNVKIPLSTDVIIRPRRHAACLCVGHPLFLSGIFHCCSCPCPCFQSAWVAPHAMLGFRNICRSVAGTSSCRPPGEVRLSNQVRNKIILIIINIDNDIYDMGCTQAQVGLPLHRRRPDGRHCGAGGHVPVALPGLRRPAGGAQRLYTRRRCTACTAIDQT